MLSQKISMYMMDVNLEPGDDMQVIVEEAHDSAIDRMVTTYSDNVPVDGSEAFIEFLGTDPSVDDVEKYLVQLGVDQQQLEEGAMSYIQEDLA